MKDLSSLAKTYILTSIVAGIGILAWEATLLPEEIVWEMFVLAAIASAALILKVQGATETSHYNISFLVFGFSFIFLGTPATLGVILIANLIEWLRHRYVWYIQCFNIATYLIALTAAGGIFYLLSPENDLSSIFGVLAIMVSMAVFTLINHLMIGLVIWLARGQNFRQSGVFNTLPLMIDFTMLIMGTTLGWIWINMPAAILLVTVPLYLIFSTLRMPALERKTEIDPKTGIYNARFFNEALAEELDRAKRFNRPLSIIMGDMDLLRNVNNTYGHLAGDVVLKGIAGILQEGVRDYDIVARFGGEEFAILLPETGIEKACLIAEEIRQTIEDTAFNISTSIDPIRVTMSFGVASLDHQRDDAESFIHQADIALYKAKENGRNQTCVSGKAAAPAYPGQDPPDEHHLLEGSAADQPDDATELFEQSGSNQYDQRRGTGPLSMKTATPSAVESTSSRRFVNFYVALVFLIPVFISAYLISIESTFLWTGIILFALFAFTAEVISIEIYVKETSVSTSVIPLVAGTLLFGPLGAVALAASASLGAAIKNKSPLNRFLFNFGNFTFGNLIAYALISLSGKPFSSWPELIRVLLATISVGLVYITTTFLVTGVISLQSGQSRRQIWQERYRWLAPYYLSMGIAIYILVFSYEIAGLMGILVLLVPLMMLRFSQKQYIDHTRELVNKLREKNKELTDYAQEVTLLNEEMLLTLANSIDLRDPYVMEHSRNVSRYAVLIARELGLPEEQVETVRKAGLLHDIGKLGIPESVLFKPARLTNHEYELVKRHAEIGAELIEGCHSLHHLIPIVRHHHEQYLGQGYPDGLHGEQIPIEARIVGLADAVEAMASDRPYSQAKTPQEILSEVVNQSGRQFDPAVSAAFCRVIENEGTAVIVNSARAVRGRQLVNGQVVGAR